MKLKLKFKCTRCCNNRVFIANASAQQEPQPSVWRRFGTWLNDFSDQQKPFSEFILVLVWPGLQLQEEHRVNFCQWRTKWKKKIISKRLLYPVKQLCLLLFEASESKQIRGFNAQLESPQWIDLTPRLENTHLAAVCQLFGSLLRGRHRRFYSWLVDVVHLVKYVCFVPEQSRGGMKSLYSSSSPLLIVGVIRASLS